MVVFPNCKINLGLRVLRKRSDGFHDIETFFYPLPLYDVLELIPATGDGLSFRSSGLPIEGRMEDNLCVKAYHLLKNDHPSLRAGQMYLYKNIPPGAGLGGGSADGAFALQLLNERFKLDLTREQLLDDALDLGSDCPFFIINKPCYATGRGEKMEPVAIDLSSYAFIIINPRIPVHTGTAFSGITPALPDKSIRDIIRQPVTTWKDELLNDFEQTVFREWPAIEKIKSELYQKGAIYASMSGTGSTVYGIFEKGNIPQFSFPSNYFIKEC